MPFLKYFITRNKALVIGTSSLVGLQTLVMLYLPYLIAVMINDGILKQNNQVIINVGIKMLFTLVIETLFGLLSCYFASELASRFGETSRRLMVRKVQKIKVDEVNQFSVASLVTRMGADNVNVQQMIVSFFQMVLPGPLIGIVAIYMTFILSPELALIPFAIVAIYIIILILILFESHPYIEKVQQCLDNMTKIFREYLIGVRIIRAFDQSLVEKKRVDQGFGQYAENNIRINILFAVLSPVAYTLMTLSTAAVLWVGAMLVAQSYVEIGEIAAVLEYSTMSIGMLIVASLVLFQLPKTLASLNRISEVITFTEKVKDVGSAGEQSLLTVKKQVVARFDKVTMSYTKQSQPAIEDISFQLERGKTLAIVGATGDGKTTILKTLLRLNEHSVGEVLLNEQPIGDIALSEVRDFISYVPQKNFLFSGTIRENISFSSPGIASVEVLAAAKVAQAYDFIASEPAGFDTLVEQGGGNFSGGQRQRLAIARSLFKKNAIYLFDDSFSALDYATDLKVRQGIKEALADSAVLIVAQRIHSIIAADSILVLEKGQVVGRGTHEQLLKENKYYQKIAKSQGFLEDINAKK